MRFVCSGCKPEMLGPSALLVICYLTHIKAQVNTSIFVDCINPKSFLRRKILAAFQTKLVSADFLSLAHPLCFHGTKPLWLCLGRGFLKAAMKMISSRYLWGEKIHWEELVINKLTMKLAKSSFQKEIVQILWYPLSSSSSNQMSLCQKALQRTT